MTPPPGRRRRHGLRRVGLLPVGLLLAALGATACGPATAPVSATQDQTVHLVVDGRDRSYLLEPATGTSGQPAAVVVVLHQEGGTPQGLAAETELAPLRAHGATLIYPAGVDHSWDAGACCGLPRRQGVDDLAFLDAVLRDVARRTPVDPQRTALVGYSSGGMLTYRYLCSSRPRITAAVVVSGSLEVGCDHDVAVPAMLELHGKRDGTIGLNSSVFVRALGLTPRPLASSLAILTQSAHCSVRPTTWRPDAEIHRWECRGYPLEAILVPHRGHGWKGLQASQRTQSFLRAWLLGPGAGR